MISRRPPRDRCRYAHKRYAMSAGIGNTVATDIATFVNGVVAATRHFGNSMPWWRGHARRSWKLHPSLYHKGFAATETNLVARFNNHAPARHNSVPASGDLAGWLFLMQHYGLPTRLLDWTESPLVALYFAVANHEADDEDSSVWALAPTVLNETQTGERSTFGVGNARIRPLVQQAWQKPPGGSVDQSCLAINSQHQDVRQMVQAAACTIHGSEQPLEDRAAAETYLYSITIPANRKAAFRQLADLLHLSELYLFPDLEHLAKHVQRTQFAAK